MTNDNRRAIPSMTVKELLLWLGEHAENGKVTFSTNQITVRTEDYKSSRKLKLVSYDR